MKSLREYFLLPLFISFAAYAQGQNIFTSEFCTSGKSKLKDEEQLLYYSPLPDSKFHSPETSLILRHDVPLDDPEVSVRESLVVHGRRSGTHSFQVLVSKDLRTINIVFDEPFLIGESVVVVLNRGLKTTGGEGITPQKWNFTISPKEKFNSKTIQEDDRPSSSAQRSSFPEIEIIEGPVQGLAPGNIFLYGKEGNDPEVFILDQAANTPAIWNDPEPQGGHDFKVNGNGSPTYVRASTQEWVELDNTGEIISTYSMINGYVVDFHEFQLLEDGTSFMIAYDQQPYDMSQDVEGGNPDAEVIGFVIQEFDENNILQLQWRSWDYLEITDNEDFNLLAGIIDAFHINAVEVDNDENVMISLRHTNEILKFDRVTGDIIWRWGINDANDWFQFTNDGGFSFQHDIRRLENGNLLLFDNANVTTQVSRAVEYSMDLENMQVTKEWEYIHPEELFGSATGGAQRLPNGNTIIYWGSVSLDEYGARFTEVDGDGNILLEFAMPLGWESYRIHKSPYEMEPSVYGCTDPFAINYNPDATVNIEGSCQYDLDGDGYSVEMGDCDDSDGDINPEGIEIPYDGIDQDCDGEDLVDVDGDGYSPDDGDCNDEDEDIFPGADEIPYDGIDQDCDGMDLDDLDGDGYSPEDGDCNDDDEDINPDAQEIPNDGIDQDCDGEDLVVGVNELAGSSFYFNGQALVFTDARVGTQISLLNDIGQLVLSERLTSSTQVIDLRGFSPGIYLVRTNSESHKIYLGTSH